ncbi:hypothetical protein LT493_25215 [Streptomyces tricolor]|nr:hypothetical protein [Streptomyces tricolor]
MAETTVRRRVRHVTPHERVRTRKNRRRRPPARPGPPGTTAARPATEPDHRPGAASCGCGAASTRRAALLEPVDPPPVLRQCRHREPRRRARPHLHRQQREAGVVHPRPLHGLRRPVPRPSPRRRSARARAG